jgi:hypothetical protein
MFRWSDRFYEALFLIPYIEAGRLRCGSCFEAPSHHSFLLSLASTPFLLPLPLSGMAVMRWPRAYPAVEQVMLVFGLWKCRPSLGAERTGQETTVLGGRQLVLYSGIRYDRN